MLYPLVKLDEKYESEVGEPVLPTSFALHKKFVQKSLADRPKMALSKIWRCIRIQQHWKPPNRCVIQIEQKR